jgi:EmrB/QacA subfamily drug resistance transporter
MSVSQLSQGSAAGTEVPGATKLPRKGVLLAVCCVAQFMVILDLSIVNVALPSIQVGLNFSSADLQWVIDAYAIVFAGFLMLGGRAADIFGHRRTFGSALFVFGLASLIGGAAPTSGVMILARGVQGFGGALMAASSLAIITSAFAPGPERHRAIALWGAMNGAGGAAGTFFGGLITQELSWRWVLLINVPIAIVTILIARSVVSNERSAERKSFDLLGALLLTGGLLIEAYGGVTAGSHGWGSADALVPIVLGNIPLALFPIVEKRAKAPLVPPKSFTPPLRIINGIVLLFSAALFPMWYVGSLYLQQVLALTPLTTGLTFLPMALAIFACASQAGKVVGRAGVRPVLGSGLLGMTVGLVLLSRIGSGGSAIQYVLVPGILVAIGIGFSIVPSTIAATMTAGPAEAGLASGLVNTARQVGGGLGLAILISIATQHTAHLIGANHDVNPALTSGFRIAYLIGAGLCAVAAVMAFTLLPGSQNAGQSRAARRVLAAAAAVLAVFVAVDVGVPRTHAAPIGAYVTKGTFSFVTEPGLHPPKMYLVKALPAGQQLPGYLMLANFLDVSNPPMVGQSGPLMLDSGLQPVWFKPVPLDDVAGNLEAQTYEGQPVLTYWQGDVSATGLIDKGEDVVVNKHYQTIATLKGVDGWVLTLHSMTIVGHDAWVTANRNVSANLSKYGGVNDGVYVDSAVQKYDLRNGKLLYSWKASDHIPLSESHAQPPPNGFPWDAYHVNSISLAANGDFLASMRNTWGAYLVDGKTGNIVWTLGGRGTTIQVPRGAQFQWQHDVELQPNSEVSMFDDHCCQISGAGTFLSGGPSRALVFKVNLANHTATPVADYSHGSNFNSRYMGNAQPLPNGNVIIGWGEVPYFTEYSKTGQLLFDGALPTPDLSYRTYVQPWVGTPSYPPRGAAQQDGGKTTVYASWNGATQVASWRVLGGSGAGAPAAVVGRGSRDGFETAIEVPTGPQHFLVQALDPAGHVIGTSKTFNIQR